MSCDANPAAAPAGGEADEADRSGLARRLAGHCAAYKGADLRRGILQLATTVVPFALLVAAMLVLVDRAYWLSLVLALPTAGLLVRFFIIQHDCGHGSFFAGRTANDLLGRLISLLTLTPYGPWRRAHAVHHATSGHLGRRGTGDITTLTVREYREASRLARLRYWYYRHPAILLLLGAPFMFLVLQRIPLGFGLPFRQQWRGVMALNAAILMVYGPAVALVGLAPFLMAYLPVLLMASWIGGWLFYVQHQFEATYWADGDEWSVQEAALKGSSHYVLPRVLQWFTGSIGLHHIHHLCSMIPNYRLQQCLDGSTELQGAGRRLTLLQSLRCIRLTLWDEERGSLVSFREARHSRAV